MSFIQGLKKARKGIEMPCCYLGTSRGQRKTPELHLQLSLALLCEVKFKLLILGLRLASGHIRLHVLAISMARWQSQSQNV